MLLCILEISISNCSLDWSTTKSFGTEASYLSKILSFIILIFCSFSFASNSACLRSSNIFSPLIRVHWELVIVIERNIGRTLMWVEPLNILHQNKSSVVNAEVNSGRTETNHPSIY